jgi:S-(hydroxymethyl)glutathione dehydrogenase / alcohol dehydrogenase
MKNVYNSNFAVLYQLKKPLVVKKLNIPKLKRNQILIKIRYSFICGTQLNEIFGLKGKDKYLPHVLGHEASGEIIGFGPNVKKFKIGEKVFLSWIKKKESGSANPYYFDKKNKKINSGFVSTFSNLTIASKDRVYKIPSKLPLDLAALFGCALPTGFGIIFKFLKKVSNKDFVGIYGVGGVGIMSIIALKASGVKNIYAVDKNKKNLLIAKKLGCKFAGTLDEINNKIAKQKIEKTKIKYNFEMSGNSILMEHAINNLSNNGTMVFAGNPKKGAKINLNPYDLIFGKKIYGFSGNDVSLEKNVNKYEKIIKKIGHKKIKSIFSTYRFKNINKAIQDFKKGSVIRPLIKF